MPPPPPGGLSPGHVVSERLARSPSIWVLLVPWYRLYTSYPAIACNQRNWKTLRRHCCEQCLTVCITQLFPQSVVNFSSE